MKDTGSSYYRVKYEMIAKRRGKKRAITAIARMILTAVYQMMSTGEVWNPTDLVKIDMPENLKEKQTQRQIDKSITFLKSQGINVA